MYFEIDALGKELDDNLEQFQETLSKASNFNVSDRYEKLQRCAFIQQDINVIRDGFILELDQIPTEKKELRVKYAEQLRDRDLKFKELVKNLEIKTNEIDREQLQAEAEEVDDTIGSHFKNTTLLVSEGDKAQDKTQEAVDRIKKKVVDSEKVGISTLGKTEAQTQQVQQVQSNLTDVNENVKQARTVVLNIIKNAASDRLVQILLFAVIVCGLVIIFLNLL